MADFDSVRIAATPGLVGQSSFASTLGAAAMAGIAGPVLTCAIGSLAFLAVELSPYSIEARLAAAEPGLCCSGELSALKMFFVKAGFAITDYWPSIMVWGAIAGALSSALILNATFLLFRRAAWKPVLHSALAIYFILPVVILQVGLVASGGVYNDGKFVTFASAAFILGCGVIGVWPVWDHLGGFAKSARYLAPPKGLSTGTGQNKSVSFRAASVEIRRANNATYKRAIKFNGAAGLAFLSTPILGYLYLHASVFAIAVIVLWPVAKFVLIAASLFRANSNRGVLVTIDRRGLTDQNDTLAWTDIGRVWPETSNSRNLLILEISPLAYRRVSRHWSWSERLLHLGYARLKALHIGTFTTVFDTDLWNATAQEILDAIETRRPPKTQWMKTGARIS